MLHYWRNFRSGALNIKLFLNRLGIFTTAYQNNIQPPVQTPISHDSLFFFFFCRKLSKQRSNCTKRISAPNYFNLITEERGIFPSAAFLLSVHMKYSEGIDLLPKLYVNMNGIALWKLTDICSKILNGMGGGGARWGLLLAVLSGCCFLFFFYLIASCSLCWTSYQALSSVLEQHVI